MHTMYAFMYGFLKPARADPWLSVTQMTLSFKQVKLLISISEVFLFKYKKILLISYKIIQLKN